MVMVVVVVVVLLVVVVLVAVVFRVDGVLGSDGVANGRPCSSFTNYQSPVTNYQSPVTSHQPLHHAPCPLFTSRRIQRHQIRQSLVNIRHPTPTTHHTP